MTDYVPGLIPRPETRYAALESRRVGPRVGVAGALAVVFMSGPCAGVAGVLTIQARERASDIERGGFFFGAAGAPNERKATVQ